MEMDRYIKAIAARGDMRVVWEDTEQPRTDGRTIWLPRLGADAPSHVFNKIRHFATHEVDHNLFTGFKGEWENVDATRSLLGAIHNLVEDHRVEWLGVEGYEGDRQCSNEVRPELMRSVLKNIPSAPQEKQDDILPLLAWSNKKWIDLYPSCLDTQEAVENLLSPLGKERYEKLCSGKYDAAWNKARDIANPDRGTAVTYELAKTIFEEVYGGDAKKEEERCNQEAEQEAKDKQEGKGKEKEKGKGKPEAGKEKGNGEGEGENADGEKREQEAALDYSKLMPETRASKGETWSPVHARIEDDYKGTENYTPATPDRYRLYNYTKEPAYTKGYYTSVIDALQHTSPAFAHKVRSILQVRARDRYHYGLKQGKLNVGSMHRIVVKDAPGYNQRVFKKREVNDVLDAAVTLLVDQSGSMGGSKFIHAAAAATMLNNIVANILHIPVEIVSFSTEGYRTSAMFLHRTFNDKLVPNENLAGRFAKAANSGMSGNADGDAVMWVFDRLMQRPEKRKLLIVFSDGQPTGGDGDPDWYLKHVVSQIEQHSPVSIVGIGLQNRAVQRYYKEHQVITNVSHLEEALLNVIEGKLK